MKTLILILSMLLFNAFCMGQCIDSFNIVYRGENGVWKIYDRNAPATYELVDSVWLNDDETWIIYSYRCKDNWYFNKDGNSRTMDSLPIQKPKSKLHTTTTTSSKGTDLLHVKAPTSDIGTPMKIPKGTFGNIGWGEPTPNIKSDTVWIHTGSFDSIMWSGGSSGTTANILFDSVTINGNEEPVYHRKRDTVPVILIVIDTSSRISLLMIITDPLSKAKSDGRLPFWIKGYSVREQHAYIEKGISTMPYEDQYYWEHIYFLDEDKKQLPKNIIVWQSKEISQ